MNSSLPVRTLDAVRAEIKAFRGTGMTYKKIGAHYGVGRGNVWNVEHGSDPTSYRIRVAFGLDPILNPQMYNEVLICSVDGCDIPFIPNSPLRTRCFRCSPFKRKETIR